MRLVHRDGATERISTQRVNSTDRQGFNVHTFRSLCAAMFAQLDANHSLVSQNC
jgi:hypothetical protein